MRQFINVSWNNSSAVYDGSQQINHFKANGAANILAYAEEGRKRAKKVKKPDLRLTSEKTIDRLEKHRADLEAAFQSGELPFDRYDVLLREWEGKMDRAWKRNEKVTGESFKEEVAQTEPTPVAKTSIINALENAANSFRVNHPFAFTVVGCLFGCGILNLVGFGG